MTGQKRISQIALKPLFLPDVSLTLAQVCISHLNVFHKKMYLNFSVVQKALGNCIKVEQYSFLDLLNARLELTLFLRQANKQEPLRKIQKKWGKYSQINYKMF